MRGGKKRGGWGGGGVSVSVGGGGVGGVRGGGGCHKCAAGLLLLLMVEVCQRRNCWPACLAAAAAGAGCPGTCIAVLFTALHRLGGLAGTAHSLPEH